MTNVLERVMEAANQYRPHAAQITLVGKDGSLMVCRFGNPNVGWLLGFVTPTKDDNMLKINTVKYVCKMGITQSIRCHLDSSVYDLMDMIRTQLVDKETLSFKESQELLEFADFVVSSNDTTNTGYALTPNDIEEYRERTHVVEVPMA